MYDKPNYGANAATSACETGYHPRTMVGRDTLNQVSAVPTRPTLTNLAELSNELHSRLNMLEESVRMVHNRLGAEPGPEAGADPISDGGPIDYAASQVIDAIRRIDNFRTIVDTINARI